MIFVKLYGGIINYCGRYPFSIMPLLNIHENLLLFISGVGMLQGFLLANLLYFHPKSDRSVNRFLALFIFFVCIPMLIPIGQALFSWQFIMFIEPFTVISGPLLYLYVRSFKEEITWKKAWPHLAIFPFFVGIAVWSYLAVGLKYPPSTEVPEEAIKQPLSYIPVSIRFSQRLLYYYLSLRALNSYQRSIRHLFSETSRINLRWVRYLINGFLAFVLITIFFYLMILRFPENFSLWVLSIGAAMTIYIYLAAFKGIGQVTLWQLVPSKNKETLEAAIEEAEHLEEAPYQDKIRRKTGLSQERLSEIVSRIITVLEEEKLYQETELTLQQLADRLDLPPYVLSQAINDGLKKNFYDLINNYRVEEAKRLLRDESNQHYTILSVGFEAGFNSKTTFNTVFKKFTGLTPTAYREQRKQTALTA